MDITFGVLPLAVMVFQGYQQVTTFVSNYKSYDDDAQQILRTVSVLECTLKQNLELFLKDIIEEAVRRAMLDDLASPHWQEAELNSRLEKSLGTHITAVKDAISNCSLTLGRIHQSQVLSRERLAQGAAPGTRASLLSSMSCLRPRAADSAHRRLSLLVKGLVAEVRELCNELRRYISDLQSLFKVIKQSRRLEGAANDEDLSRPGTSAADMAKARRDTELIHAATASLQQAVSTVLICQCHSVHLCLDGQMVRPLAVVKGGKATQRQQQMPAEVLPQFSFLFTHRGGGPATRQAGSMLVCFQPENSGGVAAAPAPGGSGHGTICAEVAVQGEGYERYVHDASQTSSGFRLRLAPAPPHTVGGGGGGGSGGSGYLSLEQVITTRFRELTGHDRFLIAITLAQSLLHLYCSPWVRDWGISTIFYFTALEGSQAAIGRWTPYLALHPGGSDVGDRNRDVYRLGYLLLQLGDLCGDEFGEAVDESELALENVLARVYRSMGRKYVAFVRSCLKVWGQNRGLNLMRGENLSSFLAHVEELRSGARCLTPPADAMG